MELLLLDVTEYQKKTLEENLNQAAKLQMETMLNRMDSEEINAKLNQLFKNMDASEAGLKEKFQEYLKSMPDLSVNLSEEEKQAIQNKQSEVIDTKIESAFERLRGDNLYIWKQSI
jgi:uncharacterized protein YlzI (FlbEa/FlbD family)